jgi:hypothetical protein
MHEQGRPDLDRDVIEEVHARAHYFGESILAERAVVRALARLPEDAREFALDHCRFISVGHALGFYLPAQVALDLATESTDGVWLVFLGDGEEPDDAESIVAHEVAHLWLGHPPTVDSREWLGNDRAVCDLARSWGFIGKGVDPSEAESIAEKLPAAKRRDIANRWRGRAGPSGVTPAE